MYGRRGDRRGWGKRPDERVRCRSTEIGMMGAAFVRALTKGSRWNFAGGGNGHRNQRRMERRLVDDAEREWGNRMNCGRWRQAPEGSTARLLEEGVLGMGQRRVAGI